MSIFINNFIDEAYLHCVNGILKPVYFSVYNYRVVKNEKIINLSRFLLSFAGVLTDAAYDYDTNQP